MSVILFATIPNRKIGIISSLKEIEDVVYLSFYSKIQHTGYFVHNNMFIHYGVYVGVRGQLKRVVISLFYGVMELKISVHQLWWQISLPTEPPYWPVRQLGWQMSLYTKLLAGLQSALVRNLDNS